MIETRHIMFSFNQVFIVHGHTRKTILDAWNGYTATFINVWSRYRYHRVSQGFQGGAVDDITVDMVQKT